MSTPKTVLITGANTGLGFEIVKSLCRSPHPYTILVGSRDTSKAIAAIASITQDHPTTTSTLHPLQIDLSSDTSLTQAIQTITASHPRLDILINNGGAGYDHEIPSGALSLRDAFNKSWDTNVTGTHVLTTLAVPLLLQSADPRIIFMTSGTSTLTETERDDTPLLARLNASPGKGWPKAGAGIPLTAYRSCKTGLNMLMREWVRVLREDGVKVWAVSPGFLATGLNGVGAEELKKVGALDPAIGGDFVVDVVEGKRDGDVGKVIRKEMVQSW